MFESLFSQSGLSLDRLRALLEVDEAGSISQTSPGNTVRHSQFSRQLRELSEFFGCDMVQRVGKRVKLTPQGAKLAQISREYLRALEHFAAMSRGEQVEFTIAGGDSLIQWLVIPRLGKLLETIPGVRFTTESSRTYDIVRKVTDLKVDFGIIRSDAVSAGMESVELGTLSYVALVPNSLLPSKKTLTLADVFRLPFAFHDTDGRFSTQLIEIGRSLVPSFAPTLACQSFPQTMAAVQSGYFAAILPVLALNEIGLRSVRMVQSDKELGALTRNIVLVWNRRMVGIRPIASLVAMKMQAAFQL